MQGFDTDVMAPVRCCHHKTSEVQTCRWECCFVKRCDRCGAEVYRTTGGPRHSIAMAVGA